MDTNKNNKLQTEREDSEVLFNYILKHYWDFVPVREPHTIYSSSFYEKLKHFVGLLSSTPDAEAKQAISRLLTKAVCNGESFKIIIQLLDKLLNDKASLTRNEKLGLHLLDQAVASHFFSEEEKKAYDKKINLIQLNQTGTTASNLVLETPQKEELKLSQLHSEYIILYFFDPTNDECKQCNIFLQRNPFINMALLNNKLKIVAIYNKNNYEAWFRWAVSDNKWLHGWDKEGLIKNKNLYDLTSIPTLYLLDKHKKVLLKECTTEQLNFFFEKAH